MFWTVLGGLFGLVLLIGLIAQIQKCGRDPFYPRAEDDFPVSGSTGNPGGKNFPI